MRRVRPFLAIVALLLACAGIAALVGRDDRPSPETGVAASESERNPGPPLGVPTARAVRERSGARGETPPSADEPAPEAAEPLDPAERPDDAPTTVRTVRLRVEAFDALTGSPVPVRWRVRGPVGGPLPPGVEPASQPPPPPARPEDFVDERARMSGLLATLVAPNDRVKGPVVIDPPPPYLPPENSWFDTSVADGVTNVVYRVPLWRAMQLDVTVLGPDGRPARGARVGPRRIAGRTIGSPHVVDDTGRTRLDGIPFVPGETLVAEIDWVGDGPARDAEPPTELEIAERSDETAELKAPVPVSSETSWSIVVRLAGPTPGRDHCEVDFDNIFEEPLPEPAPEAHAAPVTVSFRSASGAAIPRGKIRLVPISSRYEEVEHETNAGGLARFDRLPRGTWRIVATAPGTLRTVRTFAAGDTASRIDLREPVGARLDVLVVREDGTPCPGSVIEVPQLEPDGVFDSDGREQRLDPFTDEAGRRTLRRVVPGAVDVRARHGARSGTTSVDIEDGVRREVRVVVR